MKKRQSVGTASEKKELLAKKEVKKELPGKGKKSARKDEDDDFLDVSLEIRRAGDCSRLIRGCRNLRMMWKWMGLP